MTKRFLIIFAALLVTAIPAFASTIMYQDTQALPVDAGTTLNLSKFDTSLGTLTNVWVQIEVRLSGASVELDNDAVEAQVGTARVLNTASSLTSSVTLLKPDFSTINASDLTINATQAFSLTGTTGGPNDPIGFNATLLGDYGKWEPGTITGSGSGNISNLVWGGYEGTGNFTITVNTTYLTSATFVGNDGYFQGNTPNGEFYGKVIYTYDPIPEPATITLLCTGAFTLLKRKSSK